MRREIDFSQEDREIMLLICLPSSIEGDLNFPDDRLVRLDKINPKRAERIAQNKQAVLRSLQQSWFSRRS